MSNKRLVSAIITTKNEENNIENCLKSIIKQTYKDIEIIVVDNNSSDQTKQIAKKYTTLVFNKGPERSEQRNFGARKAEGDYLLFLDADMILTPKVVEECVKECQMSSVRQGLRLSSAECPQDKNVGAVIIPEKSIGDSFWAKCKALERSFYLGESSIEAARFFEKKSFWEAGGYDEQITGPEDWDLPQRIKLKKTIARIKSFILHNEGRISLIAFLKKKRYYGLKVGKYLSNNHPFRLTAQQLIYLLRPAFYKKWKLFLKNPILSVGMVTLLLAEQIAGFWGYIEGNFLKK